MDELLQKQIEEALLNSWSERTSSIYSPENPYYGQCSPTAIVIYEIFGGEILRTPGWPTTNGLHFYNRINGKRFDFTAKQFTTFPDYTHDIDYEDILSNVEEAYSDTLPGQVTELRSAFSKALEDVQER